LFQGAYACGGSGGGGGGGGRRLSIGLFALEHSPRKFSPFDTRPMRVRLPSPPLRPDPPPDSPSPREETRPAAMAVRVGATVATPVGGAGA